jgi:hypothetical protein
MNTKCISYFLCFIMSMKKKKNYTLWKGMGITSSVINLENNVQVVQSYRRKEHEKIEVIKPRRRQDR